MMDPKEQARAFLKRYAEALKDAVQQPAAAGYEDVGQLATTSESGFILGWALPVLSALLRREGLTPDEARQALLAEEKRPRGIVTSGTPARGPLSPFAKDLGITAAQQYARWCQPRAMVQPCPDFALREPCAHRIVFEAKHLKGGVGAGKARRDLVQTIYEANFYLSQAAVPAGKVRPAYDYEYGCLVALDSTRDGALQAAWRALRPEVRRGFWDGANLFVIVLRAAG